MKRQYVYASDDGKCTGTKQAVMTYESRVTFEDAYESSMDKLIAGDNIVDAADLSDWIIRHREHVMNLLKDSIAQRARKKK